MTRTRIAILGGGTGALTTAFYLTSQPGWRDRYDVTVYQMGWRLGGKGASGRNRERADRIEEHGLHVFLGFYDNAFELMQQTYGELGRPPGAPLARWDQAWRPHSYFVLEEDVGDRVVPWQFEFPTNSGVPGDGGDLPTPWQILQIVLGWARELFEGSSVSPARAAVAGAELDRAVGHAGDRIAEVRARRPGGHLRRVLATVVELVADAADAFIASTFLHAAEHHARRQAADVRDHDHHDHDVLVWLLRAFIVWLKGHWRAAAQGAAQASTDVRRTLIALDALVAVAVGLITDELLAQPVDWFKIDDLRFEDWLVAHGAERASVEAPPVRLFRELVFGHDAGVGAGTCLHYALRMIYSYKGAFAYKMQAGMGDAMFAPLYQVLAARGVRFEFFHAVDEIAPGRDAAGDPVVESIAMSVQAEVTGGGPYQPLVEVGGLACWPAEPLYEQLVQGDALRASGENLENWWTRWPAVRRRVLRRGVDFDRVVLGISIGAYPYICKPLIADAPRFARMVDAVQVTETQAAQLWLGRDVAALGWPLGADPIVGTYRAPFDTIADMTHLLARERWPAGAAGGVVYLTSLLPPDGRSPTPPRSDWQYPFDRRADVRANLAHWLDSHLAGLLPRAVASGTGARGLARDLFVAAAPAAATAGGAAGGVAAAAGDPLDAQYWTASWNPSDRYVLSAPGTVRSRLASAATGFHNLVMAGDWTLTALSAGCVEAAVMSGMHAARALCGHPAHISGDDLPDGEDPVAIAAARPGRYIELETNDTPLHPYTARNVTMYSFALEADRDRLQAICDHQLNLGGPTIYRPLGPFAFFVAAITSPIAPASPRAWTDERDFGFWIPVVAGTRDAAGEFRADRPAFFIPYLWVDSHLAAQAGREVFGYPKAVGRLAHPAAPGDDAAFSIDALVVPEYGAPGDPDAKWQWRRLVTAARRGGGRWSDLAREVGSLVDLGRAVVGGLAREIGDHAVPELSRALLASLIRDARALEVPMVFLKQFRDAADGTQACYQAIVEAPNRMTHDPVEFGLLHGDWELAIAQFASCRLIDRLGLRVHADGSVRPAFQFWVKFGFTAEPGRVVDRIV